MSAETARASQPSSGSAGAEDIDSAVPRAGRDDLVILASRAVRRVLRAVGTLLSTAESLLSDRYLATFGIAVTRILLGITGIGLILTNFGARHYVFGVAGAWSGELAEPVSDFPSIWLFSAFHRAASSPTMLTLLMIALGGIAVLIVLGWRTRLVLPVYLIGWVSFIELNDAAGDQGDNAYRMFLIAMLFTNSSMRWSLDARRRRRAGRPDPGTGRWSWIPVTAHNLALLVLAFQVCAIYVSGGLYKAGGVPWQQGYAIYNPLHTSQFGTWPVLSDLVTAWAPGLAALTIGSLIFQIAFPFLLFNRWTRIIALLAILSFHLGIGLLMGLPWFSLTMIAVDAIFIRDRTYERLGRGARRVREALAADRGLRDAPRRDTSGNSSQGPPG